MNSDAEGSFSDGLRMNVLPHASALPNIHIGTIAGKLNGVMPATTPSGWRIWYTSTPVDACSLKPPLRRCGTPQANSRFSRPRATSPSASDGTLPCSAVSSAAMSRRWWSTRLRIRNRISVRFESDVARQAGNAAFAAATAASTSSTDAKSTHFAWAPVAGSNTGPRRPDRPSTGCPPIQWPMVGSEADVASAGSASWVMGGLPGGCRRSGVRAPL